MEGLWTNLLCTEVIGVKHRSDAPKHISAWAVLSVMLPAEWGKGLYILWVFCTSIRIDKHVMFCAAASLHLRYPFERKRVSSSSLFLSGTEVAQVPGKRWQWRWGTGNWMRGRVQQTGVNKIHSPFCLDNHHRWPGSSLCLLVLLFLLLLLFSFWL